MNYSKEDWNKNDPNQNRPLETEGIDMNPVKYAITEVEEEPNQRPGCSNENTTTKTIIINAGSADSKMPIKFEFGLPPSSRDKSNVRITWDNKNSGHENELLQSISMSALVNIPYDDMMQAVDTYLKSTERRTKDTKTTGTQTTSFDAASSSKLSSAAEEGVVPSSTTPYPAASRFYMPYNYQFPTEYDDDDDDDD